MKLLPQNLAEGKSNKILSREGKSRGNNKFIRKTRKLFHYFYFILYTLREFSHKDEFKSSRRSFPRLKVYCNNPVMLKVLGHFQSLRNLENLTFKLNLRGPKFLRYLWYLFSFLKFQGTVHLARHQLKGIG